MDINDSHRLFANIGKISTGGHSFNDTINRIMHEIKIFFRPVHCSLFRLDNNTDELFFASIMGMDIEKVKSIRLKLNEGIAGKVAATQISYFVPDTAREPHFSRKVDQVTGFVTKSIIAVPLVFQKTTQGVIEIVNRTDGGIYTDADHLILQTIADFAAIALYNASLFNELFVKAHYDPLTALYNRTRLNVEFEKHAGPGHKTRRVFEEKIATLVLLDLNDFKLINDNHGHLIGDNVLKNFATKLRKVARDTDLVFRIGGDEFLILGYNYSRDEAEKFKDRLVKKIKLLKENVKKYDIPYDFSYGAYTGDPENMEELIHNADLDMYEDKKQKSKA